MSYIPRFGESSKKEDYYTIFHCEKCRELFRKPTPTSRRFSELMNEFRQHDGLILGERCLQKGEYGERVSVASDNIRTYTMWQK